MAVFFFFLFENLHVTHIQLYYLSFRKLMSEKYDPVANLEHILLNVFNGLIHWCAGIKACQQEAKYLSHDQLL